MDTTIRINSRSYEIPTPKSIFHTYQMLNNLFAEEDLFLLESLSGSQKDCMQSVIGYKPLLSIKWNGHRLQLSGNQHFIDRILSQESLQSLSCQNNVIMVEGKKNIFELLRTIEATFSVQAQKPDNLFGCGFFGYIGYDAIFEIENITQYIPRSSTEESICLTLFEGIIHINLLSQITTLTINESELHTTFPDSMILKAIADDTTHTSQPDVITNDEYSYKSHSTVNRNRYFDWVNKAKNHISLGDVYQIQFGYDIHIHSAIPPFQTYQRLRKFNPSPYMYYFTGADQMKVIGASPEMFAILDSNGIVQMRPIAGTARKSGSAEEIEIIRQKLLADEKEQAEHLMLVDLCRNDIARICTATTLQVDELMVTEEYSHVIHIVSHVSGKLKANKDKYDLIAATFPAGTMTGTPKIRAVEIIEETESTPRGVYAGCVGFFGFNNTMVTALCIRTAVWQEQLYTIRASAGIVEDSTPQQEWAETISKMSSTYFAITNRELTNEDFIN